MLKLYETHTSSLGSVIQSLHNHSNLLQTLQDQQVRILTSISPIEPLIKSIPMHFDASQNSHHTRILSALESSIEKAVLHGIKPFFSRIAITGTEPHPSYLVPGSPPEQSERGQKRRLGERDDHPSDSVNSPPHRPSSMTATAHTRSATKIRAHGNVYSSSPLAVRRRSSVWTPTHLQRRASNRHLSSKAAPADEARNDNLTAALNEAQAPAAPSRSFRPSSILHRSSARPPAGLGCASRHVSLSVESSRTRSQVHIGGVIVPSSAKRPSAIEAEKNAVPARITRFFTKPFEALDVQNDAAPLNEVTASTDPEPASPTPDALNQSRNGPQIERTRPIDVSIEPSAVKAPELVTTEGAAGTTSVSKNNKKTKRVSKPSKAKAKGSNDKSKKGGKDKKGKKVPGTGPPDLGNAGSSRADEIVDGAKEPNAKRQKTTASDTTTATETSGVSEHGPPNSPSRPTSIIDLSRQSRSPSSVIRATPSLIDLSSTRYTTRLGITTKAKPSPLEAQTPLRRRLIDIRNSSACTEEDDGAAVSLAAALAHVTSDVNFMNSDNMTNSRLIPTEVDDCLTKGALGLNFPGELPTSDATFVTSSSGIGSGIIVSNFLFYSLAQQRSHLIVAVLTVQQLKQSHPQSGRSKRYLVADDSTTIDLLFDDDLLDE